MDVLTKIVFFILLLPIIGICVWGLLDPIAFITSGQRWKYKGEIEPTDEAIKHSRKICIAVIVITIVIYLFYAIFR